MPAPLRRTVRKRAWKAFATYAGAANIIERFNPFLD
jgi:hypothetical protein